MKKYWFWIALILLTIISLIFEFTMSHNSEHHNWWSSIPAFWIIFGFLGCALLVVFSKGIGKLFLDKKEDYYDDK